MISLINTNMVFPSWHHGIMKAYKYRLYPNSEQKVLIAKHFGCARFVYSWALSEKKMSEKDKHHKETGKGLSKRQLQDMVVASKKADREWLTEVNSQSLLASPGQPGNVIH